MKKRKYGNGRRVWIEESRCGKNEESGRRVRKWERVQISNVGRERASRVVNATRGTEETGQLLATSTAIPAVLC